MPETDFLALARDNISEAEFLAIWEVVKLKACQGDDKSIAIILKHLIPEIAAIQDESGKVKKITFVLGQNDGT